MKGFLAFPACFLVAFGTANAALIQVDNAVEFTDADNQILGATTGTISGFAVADNPYRYLVVAAAGEQTGAPTSVTYGGTPLVQTVSATQGASHSSIFTLADPAVGSGDISLTGFGGNGLRFGALSIYSAAPFGLHDAPTSFGAFGTPDDLVYAGFPSDGFYVEALERNSNTSGLSVAGSTTLFGPGGGFGGFGARGVYGTVPSGTLSHSYSFSDRHAIAGVAFVAPEPSRALLLSLAAGLMMQRRRR